MTDDGQDLAALENLAARVAPELAGLTREQAEAHLAATDPRLSARFAETGTVWQHGTDRVLVAVR